MFKKLIRALLVSSIFAVATTAVAADTATKTDKPDATFTLSQGSVGLGVGYSWGEGTLKYGGKEYKFKVDGLSIGDVGVAKSDLTGEVFHLDEVSKFDGTYASATAAGTLGGGGSASMMKNQNGVVISLTGASQGLNIKLATDGMKFKLQG